MSDPHDPYTTASEHAEAQLDRAFGYTAGGAFAAACLVAPAFLMPPVFAWAFYVGLLGASIGLGLHYATAREKLARRYPLTKGDTPHE